MFTEWYKVGKRAILLLLTTTIIIPFRLHGQQPSWAWARSGTSNNTTTATSVAIDSQGNVYVAGEYSISSITFDGITLDHYGNIGPDIFIVKYSHNGSLLWAIKAGGYDHDEGGQLFIDQNDRVYLSCHIASQQSWFGAFEVDNPEIYDYNAVIARVDPDGGFLWAYGMGGDNFDFNGPVVFSPNGDLYMLGAFDSDFMIVGNDTLHQLAQFGNDLDMFLVKMSPLGTPIWARAMVGPENESSWDIASTASGDVYVSGNFTGDYIMVDGDTIHNLGQSSLYTAFFFVLDDAGSLSRAMTCGGNSQVAFSDIFPLPSGLVALRGSSSLTDYYLDGVHITGPAYNPFIAGVDDAGMVQWASLSNTGLGFKQVDKMGDLYFSGSFTGPSFSVGGFTLLNSGTYDTDIYVYASDSLGTVKWAISAGGAGYGYDQATDVASWSGSSAYCVGNFGTTLCDFGSIQLQNPDGESDTFIAKIDGISTTAVVEVGRPEGPEVFPDPFDDVLFVTLPEGSTSGSFEIRDAFGRIVDGPHSITPGSNAFNTSRLTAGIYYAQVHSRSVRSIKLVKY
ncbi:MAG: SBBP repeat-containing protein [Flavobacteriales bacterium]|nr:SBBP repeat-containing protein [Flavobacteriales bacterium]